MVSRVLQQFKATLRHFMMLIILILTCIARVFSQSIYDVVVGTIQCSCERETGLDVSKTKVHFWNYAPGGKENSSYIDDAPATILNSGGLATNQCVDILIPGFNTNITHYSIENAKCVYSQRQCNGSNTFLIIIDHYEYTKGSSFPPNNIKAYENAVKFTKSIGQAIGKMLIKMLRAKLVDPSNLRMMGHSLGAHMAGYAGVLVIKESTFIIARIDGTDSAGPCYDDCPNEHLQSGNAKLVVGYHCTQTLGSMKSVCDYDMFSNDGKDQSDCSKDIVYGMSGALCSHYSCVAIALLPAIKDDIWIATNCLSYDDYKSGKCSDNEKTLAGYSKTPVGPNGKYYFSSSNYNCTKK